MIEAPGCETLITHVFRDGDPYLDSDVVFGVRASLIGDYRPHAAGTGPHAREVDGPYHTLDFDFVLQRRGEPAPAAG
jgi:hydroxyquinol 1,2-dioxygenase